MRFDQSINCKKCTTKYRMLQIICMEKFITKVEMNKNSAEETEVMFKPHP